MKDFWLATGAAFAVSFALSFVFHGIVLAEDYNQLLAVYRGPQFRPGMFALLLLAQLIMAAAIAAIYRYGREERPFLGQGVRFGLLAAGLSVIPWYLIGYVVTNIPAFLAIKQIVLEAIKVVAMGVTVAWAYSSGAGAKVSTLRVSLLPTPLRACARHSGRVQHLQSLQPPQIAGSLRRGLARSAPRC